MIDAGQLYRKLRKNLGNKNCEFAPEHISEILEVYTELKAVESEGDTSAGSAQASIGSQIFDNEDFGYYKVTIERPKRLKAQFTEERIEGLRYDRILQEPMQYAYETFGESVYQDIKIHAKEIVEWCEQNDINLSSANKKKLTNKDTWKKHQQFLKTAKKLEAHFGDKLFNDFSAFDKEVNKVIKEEKLDVSASDKKAILNAVSWYDADAEKVIKKKEKLTGDRLQNLLIHLGCKEEDLADYGYFPAEKKGEYITYETESDLRDTENVPLKESIHEYFLKEVKPHVAEAWINLDSTKIGYEISFNKYFYKHTPLRSIEEVTKDILELERQSDGLIAEILNV